MIKLSREDIHKILKDEDMEFAATQMNLWLERGDGVAVYENHDLGHPQLGHKQFVSFGSEKAMLEVEEPPQRLPDIGNAINWRYQLVGTYRGDLL